MLCRIFVVLSLMIAGVGLASPVAAAEVVLFVQAESRTGDPLGGACFEVYVDSGNGERGDYLGAFCDDADGSLDGRTLIQVPAGRYVLAESATPDGFALPPDTPVDLGLDQPVVRLTIAHDPANAPPPTAVPATPVTPEPDMTPVTGSTAEASSANVDGRFEVNPGRSLYLSCRGAGEVTVILEAGGPGRTSDDWREVVPGLSDLARICVYDRASLGQSDPAPAGIRTIDDSVNDLHQLLAAAKITCPCIFAGNSWGGVIVRRYAGRYPDQVSGLVSVDGVPPGFLTRFLELVPDGSPPEVLQERDRLLGSTNLEDVDQRASLQLADESAPPPGVPAAVLTHGELGLGFSAVLPRDELERAWRTAQEDYAQQLNARLIVAEKSGSDLTREQPQLVVDAITYVVNVVRNPTTGLGVIQILPVTDQGFPLLGVCYQLLTVPASGEPVVRASACDDDDNSLDGSILFPGLPPGRYVVRDYHTPPGYLDAPNTLVNVPPADVARVLIRYEPENSTPVASPRAAA